MNETNWVPGLVILAASIVSAIAFLLLSRRSGASGSASPAASTGPLGTGVAEDPKLLDLDRRAQLLMEQLRGLDTEKHHMGEAEFAAEKNRLELEAAEALRARDTYLRAGQRSGATATVTGGTAAQGPMAATAAAMAGKKGFWANHPQLKGAMWGALIVGFFAAVGIFLKEAEKPRGENGTLTGKDPGESMGAPAADARAAAMEAEVNRLKGQLERNPADLETAAALSHRYILMQRFEEAAAITKKSLAQDPFHLETRVHSAVLKATQGDTLNSFRELEHLSRVYPESHEALFFLGAMSLELGDSPRALDSFERFAVTAPPHEQPPGMNEIIQELRQRVRGTP